MADRSRYLGQFVAEAREHLVAARTLAGRIADGEIHPELIRKLFRDAHSLKGMAATMGCHEIAAATHALENLLSACRETEPSAWKRAARPIQEGLVAIARMIDALETGRVLDATQAARESARLRDAADALSGPGLEATSAVVEAATVVDPPSVAAASRDAESLAGGGPWVRVPSETLTRLSDRALELVLAQSNLADAPRGDAGVPGDERCRSLARTLHAATLDLRLVRFGSVAARLEAGVLEAAAGLGKRVRLEVEGAEERLERRLLDLMVEPILHLLRNAVDHGIESADERARAGKPPTGRLRLALVRDSDRTEILVEDDGRGIAIEELRLAAVESGLMAERDALSLGEAAVLELLGSHGLSTAPRSGSLSGRGVGLEIARSAAASAGGRLRVRSAPGRGVSISLEFPAALALVPSLLIRSCGALLALPLAQVRRVRSGSTGPDAGSSEAERFVVVVESAGQSAEIEAEGIVGPRSIVVRPLGPPLDRLPGYRGAAVLDDGGIALVIDPAFWPAVFGDALRLAPR